MEIRRTNSIPSTLNAPDSFSLFIQLHLKGVNLINDFDLLPIQADSCLNGDNTLRWISTGNLYRTQIGKKLLNSNQYKSIILDQK